MVVNSLLFTFSFIFIAFFDLFLFLYIFHCSFFLCVLSGLFNKETDHVGESNFIQCLFLIEKCGNWITFLQIC